jgi:adenine phosphoribosyltransferase
LGDRQRLIEELTASFPMVDGHPDVAGVLRDASALSRLGPCLAAPFRAGGVTLVAAPEARGPILGALVARELDAGLVVVRKDRRNHPGADISVESHPTWRGRPETFIARSFDIDAGARVLVVDDWITTGSSIVATRSVIEQRGAIYVGASVLMNKADHRTIEQLAVEWLVSFDEVMRRTRTIEP